MMASHLASRHGGRRGPALTLSKALHWLVALLLFLPILAIAVTALGDTGVLLGHLVRTRLLAYFTNTLGLMVGVGGLALVFGISTAWVISRYDFPFRRWLEWMLVLPAAVPAYLVAYTYTDFLEYAGPVQTLLRDLTGWRSARDYWFPEIRSMGGAILVMASVLYPYIYITARTAFRMTSMRLFEAAILAGHRRLLVVALPLARPGIMAGLALVLMEVVSDFGTVEYFAIDTLTLGIFNVWLGMNNMTLAAQLAVTAVVLIILLLWMESQGRAGQRVENMGRGSAGVPLLRARGLERLVLPLICLVPIGLGFGLPVGVLVGFIVAGLSSGVTASVLTAIGNTALVALIAASLIMVIATFLGIMARYRSARPGQLVTALSAIGYAFPGTMLAIGVLTVSGYGDGLLRLIVDQPGVIITGSLAMLVAGYVTRFQAVGFGTVRSGLSKLPPNLVAASQVMGHGFLTGVIRVILPLLRPSLLAGLLLAFVDIMKELPMTLLLRPFNYETLATLTYQFAKEELLEEAAVPALIIVLAGLIPVIIINRALAQQRQSQGMS